MKNLEQFYKDQLPNFTQDNSIEIMKEYVDTYGFEYVMRLNDINTEEELLELMNGLRNLEVVFCSECPTVITQIDIPLCNECQKKYDLNLFWIKHDLEVGNWYEPDEFEEVKSEFIKSTEMPTSISSEDINNFREKYKDRYDFETNKVEDITIARILEEI